MPDALPSSDFLYPPGSRVRLVVLGAGQVAQHLAPALAAAGHAVVGVWSRTAAAAQALADRLPVGTVVLPAPVAAAALRPDAVLICVPDAAVAGVLEAARLPAGILVAHTAGALPPPAHPRGAVFYPLQSFSVGRAVALAQVPFCLEVTSLADTAPLTRLAQSISQVPPRWLRTPERATLHLAAVFAANFSNHVLGIAHRVLTEAGLPFAELLGPLVREVVEKALAAPAGPFSVQTGPAARGDQVTLARHRAALAADPLLADWLPVYDELTAAIGRVATPPA